MPGDGRCVIRERCRRRLPGCGKQSSTTETPRTPSQSPCARCLCGEPKHKSPCLRRGIAVERAPLRGAGHGPGDRHRLRHHQQRGRAAARGRQRDDAALRHRRRVPLGPLLLDRGDRGAARSAPRRGSAGDRRLSRRSAGQPADHVDEDLPGAEELYRNPHLRPPVHARAADRPLPRHAARRHTDQPAHRRRPPGALRRRVRGRRSGRRPAARRLRRSGARAGAAGAGAGGGRHPLRPLAHRSRQRC